MVLEDHCAPRSRSAGRLHQQLLRIMQITAIILTVACLSVGATGLSQVTLSEKDAPLDKVLLSIKKQTGYNFLISYELLEKSGTVTVQCRNLPLDEAMKMVLSGKELIYEIEGKTVIIKGRKIDPPPPPPIDVKGRVVNENGEPVLASVQVKGTDRGTTTNGEGVFELKGVDPAAVLVVSAANIETREERVNGMGELVVNVKMKVAGLNEIVINKGYYTESQRTSVSNVGKLTAKDIEKQPVQNPLLALVGRIPGVNIVQQTGFANSGIQIRIQGTNSITSGLDPLYVIDGVPYSSQGLPTEQSAQLLLGSSSTTGNFPTGGGNPLSFINPADIESIDILKDADATALYGSRGANGVVLITTKKGKAGKTSVAVTVRNGWGKVPAKLKLLNTEQYLAVRDEAYTNDGLAIPTPALPVNLKTNSNYDLTVWDPNRFTDWQKTLLGGTAGYTDANFNLSGGNANTQFLLGGGYHKETTVFPGDFSDRKGSLQFNVHHASVDRKFDLQFSGTYVVDNNRLPTNDLTANAVTLAPNAPRLYNDDGSINWEELSTGTATVSTWTNPLSNLLNYYDNKVNNLVANALVAYHLAPGLNIRSSFGYTNTQSDEIQTKSLLSERPETRISSPRSAIYGNGNLNSWIIEPQINYQRVMGQGKLEALLGSSFQRNNISREELLGTGHASDLLLGDIKSAASVTVNSNLVGQYNYNALFGRLNYNLKGRYILNATARRDGSSRFGPANLFQNFWSAAAGWIFSSEHFANKLSWLSFGKIKASIGTSGNDQIGDYKFMSLYNSVSAAVPYQTIPAMAPSGHANPYLQWEETRKIQVGLDLGFLKDRLNFSIDYYYNRTSNLLISQPLTIVTGFGSIVENFPGVLRNTGWELSVNTTNISGKRFKWTTNINVTIPVDNGVLIKFPGLANSALANTYTINRSILDRKGPLFVGIDPATGLDLFASKSGKPSTSPAYPADYLTYSRFYEKGYGGIQNNLAYKGFELDFLFQFVKREGNPYLYSYFTGPGAFDGIYERGNFPESNLQRWQKPGDIAPYQKFTTGSLTGNFFRQYMATADASFLRLTNLSFTWRVPDTWEKAAHLKDARIFLQGQNLFTISSFQGLNPAVDLSTSLPPLRVVTFGARVEL